MQLVVVVGRVLQHYTRERARLSCRQPEKKYYENMRAGLILTFDEASQSISEFCVLEKRGKEIQSKIKCSSSPFLSTMTRDVFIRACACCYRSISSDLIVPTLFARTSKSCSLSPSYVHANIAVISSTETCTVCTQSFFQHDDDFFSLLCVTVLSNAR